MGNAFRQPRDARRSILLRRLSLRVALFSVVHQGLGQARIRGSIVHGCLLEGRGGRGASSGRIRGGHLDLHRARSSIPQKTIWIRSSLFETWRRHTTGVRLRRGTTLQQRARSMGRSDGAQPFRNSDHFGVGTMVLPISSEKGREDLHCRWKTFDFAHNGKSNEGASG